MPGGLPTLHRDVETRSTLDLRDVGAWRYSLDSTTDVWCVAFSVDDGPIKLWVPGDPVPAEYVEAAQNPDWLVSAFNDQFERLIEQHIMAPRYGWPLVRIERHRCTQATALALALPAKLETAALALGLEQQKDTAGQRLMLQMAKPRRPRADEDPGGTYWFDDPERRQRLGEYCKQDVAVERALHQRIGFLGDAAQAEWILDAAINDRGLHIDSGLLASASCVAQAAQKEINAELSAITAGAVATVNETAKLMAWLAANGCAVDDVQKVTLEKALTRSGLPAGTRRVIELRLDGAHAATAKLSTIRNWCNADSRARGTFRYHGASTGRWTSHGIQLQNLKRPLVEDLGAAIEAVATGDLNHLRSLYKQPMSVVGDITRALIIAPPGHRLIAADFSGVESRITARVSGHQSKLDQWLKFDRTQNTDDEPYFIIGQEILGLRREQARVIGKTADLAFGYMGGKGAWRKLAPAGDTSTLEEIKRLQQAWRGADSQTVQFWYELDRAAKRAIQNPGKMVSCRRVTFQQEGDFLFMHLPSGRRIAYPFAHLKTNARGETVVVFMDNTKGRWTECRGGEGAYGGIWIENAVQAIARDIFAAAMPRFEAAGFTITLHVHDEIVAEVLEGFGSPEEFLRILTTPPAWAEGLPIAAKVRVGQRFCKITKPEVWSEAAESPTPEPEEPAESTDNPPFDLEEDVVRNTRAEDAPSNAYASGEREWGRNINEYIYQDAHGEPYLRVVRTCAKQFPQYHRENGRWVKGKPAGPRIPFRLPELLAGAPTEPVFVCEGEKDSMKVAELGLIATTNSEGAGKWSADLC